MIYHGTGVVRAFCIGLMVGTASIANSFAQGSPTAQALIRAAPAELRGWLAKPAPRALPAGTYPVDRLINVLPPHASKLLATEATKDRPLTLDIVFPQVYEVPISDRVNQLAANGDLVDTSRCGHELPFPGLSTNANRSGLKAVWNLLCRNQGGGFEYIAHDLRGSGPNPHRTFVINGRKATGPQGFGFHMQMLSPNDQKGNQIMGWTPWPRKAESLYMYQVETRRAREGTSNRGERMLGTYFTMEHAFGWEGQYYFYNWVMLGEHPILAALDSRHSSPQYLPVNRWFPDDQWQLRPAFLIVGQRAHNRAGSGYVALWLDTETFEPLWIVFYNEAGVAKNLTGLTFKWNTEYLRHVTLGESAVQFNENVVPIGGTVFEAPFCSVLHHPTMHVDASVFSGKQLGEKPFNWNRRPAGCQ